MYFIIYVLFAVIQSEWQIDCWSRAEGIGMAMSALLNGVGRQMPGQ